MTIFNNYKNLLSKVEELTCKINTTYKENINCKAGCSSCCLKFKLFPVEADYIKNYLQHLDKRRVQDINENIAASKESDSCPFLINQLCMIYEARPIICRTHGSPIIFSFEDEKRVDTCPKNSFKGLKLNGENVIDIEKLNSILVAINANYCHIKRIDTDKIDIWESP